MMTLQDTAALLVLFVSIITVSKYRFKYESVSMDTYVICSTILSAAVYIALVLVGR